MLHDLDDTLKKLIYERGKINKNEVEVAFDQPTSDWASRLGRPTVNCWCFDLRENIKLRNMEIRGPERDAMRDLYERGQYARGENGKVPQVALKLAPLRFNLTYLVTAWARKVEDEHRLLWRSLGALAGLTALDPGDCEGELKDQPYEIPLMVGQITEAASTFTDLWSVLDNELHLGFTLQATLALDTERGFVAPLVLESQVRVGQAEPPLRHAPSEPDGRDVEIVRRGADYKKRQDWEEQDSAKH